MVLKKRFRTIRVSLNLNELWKPFALGKWRCAAKYEPGKPKLYLTVEQGMGFRLF